MVFDGILFFSRKKKWVEAKPLVLDEMVETVGDTYWAGEASVAKKNVRGPMPRRGSGMCLESHSFQ